MSRESRSERIRRRREEMAATDRNSRRLLFLLVAGFALLVLVLLVVRRVGSGPLDLNRASVEQLQTLPGVGPETAKAIVKGRPYRSIEELAKVKGIGPATVEKLRDRVKAGD